MVTWLVKHWYSQHRYFTPHKHSVCMDVILGLSQNSFNRTIRVAGGRKSFSLWLRRAQKNVKAQPDNESQDIKSPSSHALMLCNKTCIHVCNTCHKQLAIFTFKQRFFCKTGSHRIFPSLFSHRGFIFQQATLILPSCGTSDKGQVSTVDLGQGFTAF